MSTQEAVVYDLLYSDIEQELRSTLRALLAEHADWQAVLRSCDGPAPHDSTLWRRITEDLGLASLLVPENQGGTGASSREAGVVAEELGRSVAPVPFFSSAVLATRVLVHADGDVELLSDLAEGRRTAALAIECTTPPGVGFPLAVEIREERLYGSVPAVANLASADALVVPAYDDGVATIVLVQANSPGVSVTGDPSLDLTQPIADLTLDGPQGTVILQAARAEEALQDALWTGAAVLASEQVGIAQWCLDAAVEYAKTRIQFDRPIGSFQAVKHRLADMWAEVTSARATARAAADAAAKRSPDAPITISVAAAHCAEVAVLAAEQSLQLHGGIGMTWEHPLHLYLCRARSRYAALGTPGDHRANLAVLADIPAPDGEPGDPHLPPASRNGQVPETVEAQEDQG